MELPAVLRVFLTPFPSPKQKKIKISLTTPFSLAHQNRTFAIASDFRVEVAKSPEIPQKEGVLGSEIAVRNRKSLATFHRTLKSQCSIAFPDPPILAFFDFLAFFVFRFSLLFCAFFLLFSKDFRVSAKRKTLAFFWGKTLAFSKKSKDWRVRVVSEIAAISGVRDGHRNRKSQKSRCDFGALSPLARANGVPRGLNLTKGFFAKCPGR